MGLTRERIEYLLKAYGSRTATEPETDELMNWVLNSSSDAELKDYMLQVWHDDHTGMKSFPVSWDDMYARVTANLSPGVRPERRLRWQWYAAAASVLLIFSIGALLFFQRGQQERRIAATDTGKENQDITPPAASKAVLVLADGSEVDIDNRDSGVLAVQGGIQVVKRGGDQIAYLVGENHGVGYNTLAVPKGSRPINLTLSDGSRVWINVGSSLRYPTAFTGKKREVSVRGEAYFEVAHLPGKPFEVQHDNLVVRVLGTHFNVNTYDDEQNEQITLLSGSVKVSRNDVSRMLKPGQQALIGDRNTKIRVLKDVNTQEVLAWKEGKFMFDEHADIGSIMRQIARWYNVDVEYRGKVNIRFWGTISKDVNLSEVLQILEATGGVKFEIEKNKIIVLPT